MNILILGHKGMLGHILVKYFTDKQYTVNTIDSRFPSEDFTNSILNFRGDYIINAIGSIPQKHSDFTINFALPEWLDSHASAKIIHAGTDCESDNTDYGISKKKASDWIKTNGTKTKIIKTSIIGPEINSKSSLLEWFLNSTDPVTGFANAMWNGITTLEWSKQCERMIADWDSCNTETIVYTDCISKFEILEQIKLVFSKEIHIIKDDRDAKNKCLIGDIYTGTIFQQLKELKEYYYGN